MDTTDHFTPCACARVMIDMGLNHVYKRKGDASPSWGDPDHVEVSSQRAVAKSMARGKGYEKGQPSKGCPYMFICLNEVSF